jgi:tetratricopeptide (TPR) repeat protein
MGGLLTRSDEGAKAVSDQWKRVLNTKAACLGSLRQYDEALATANRAVDMFPRDELARHSRGVLFSWIGDWQAAKSDYEEAFRLSMDDEGYYDTLVLLHGAVLAEFLATCPDERLRDGQRALKIASIGCQATKYEDADNVFALAAAHAEMGDFDEAVRWHEKALALDGKPPTETRQSQLAAYRDRKPFRDQTKR